MKIKRFNENNQNQVIDLLPNWEQNWDKIIKLKKEMQSKILEVMKDLKLITFEEEDSIEGYTLDGGEIDRLTLGNGDDRYFVKSVEYDEKENNVWLDDEISNHYENIACWLRELDLIDLYDAGIMIKQAAVEAYKLQKEIIEKRPYEIELIKGFHPQIKKEYTKEIEKFQNWHGNTKRSGMRKI